MSLEFPVPYTEFVPRGLKKQAGGGGEGSNMQWQKQTSMIIKMILALYISYVGMWMYISVIQVRIDQGLVVKIRCLMRS